MVRILWGFLTLVSGNAVNWEWKFSANVIYFESLQVKSLQNIQVELLRR
jgi:hypothetical protein